MAWRRVRPQIATGRSVAIVGSGPAGLAAAQQLTRAGHHVVVFERAEKIGGLLRYGIPEFKMEKSVLDQRLAQMATEGTEFRARVSVGSPAPGDPDGTSPPCEVPGAAVGDATVISAKTLLDQFDALVVAGGSTLPRDLPVPGRELAGIHFAMDYLKPGNLVCEGQLGASPISAAGKDVVIIGGGDTGADCLGTVHRQGARRSVSSRSWRHPPRRVRRAIPGRCGRSSSGHRPPTRKVAPGSLRSRRAPSAATSQAASARSHCRTCARR